MFDRGRELAITEEFELPLAFREPEPPESPPSAAPPAQTLDPETDREMAPTTEGLGSSEPEILEVSFSEARLVRAVAPVYPAEARRRKVGGTVVVEAVIAPSGRVEKLDVIRSLPMLDQAALTALEQWEFEPATKDGVAVRMKLAVALQFDPRRR